MFRSRGRDFSATIPAEFATSSEAIDPDAASARGALTVAAVNYADPGLNSVESFSSRGPAVTHYFDASGTRLATPEMRPKPDLAAADGVSTSMSGFSPFFGTSAAAPAAAGIVALVRSARPALTVDQIYSIMKDPRGSIDCTGVGFPDADCGWGFVLADAKVKMALDTTPPTVLPALSPASPDGANGWFHTNVGLTWNVSDPDSPVTSVSGCDPQAVTTEGVVSFTCTAVSPGGVTTRAVTIQRDNLAPSRPTFTGIAPGAGFSTATVPWTIACVTRYPNSGERAEEAYIFA